MVSFNSPVEARYLHQLVIQPLMIALVMIVHDVIGHGLLEVPLAEGNDAIETFMFDGADEALGVGIRIRRPPSGTTSIRTRGWSLDRDSVARRCRWGDGRVGRRRDRRRCGRRGRRWRRLLLTGAGHGSHRDEQGDNAAANAGVREGLHLFPFIRLRVHAS
jgi:hypothetical protein